MVRRAAAWAFALFAGGFSAFGQTWDAGTWTSINLSSALAPRWDAGLGLEARTEARTAELEAMLTEATLKWKGPHVDLAAGLRLDASPGEARFSTRGSFRASTTFPLPGGARLGLRAGYQRSAGVASWWDGAAADQAREAARFRLSADLARGRRGLRPGASAEFFFRPVAAAPGAVVWTPTDLRARAGAELELPGGRELTCAYQIEYTLRNPDPATAHTLLLALQLALPGRKQPVAPAPAEVPAVPAAAVFGADGLLAPRVAPATNRCGLDVLRIEAVHTEGVPADWVLLRNAGATACSLEGIRLDDAPEFSDLTFGAVAVPAGGAWLGYRGGAGGFASGLSAEGDALHLAHPDGGVRSWVLRANPDGLPEGFDAAGNGQWLPAGWRPPAGSAQ
jgi:hypothetical protein